MHMHMYMHVLFMTTCHMYIVVHCLHCAYSGDYILVDQILNLRFW